MTALDEALALLRDAPVFTGYPEWVERRDALLAAVEAGETQPLPTGYTLRCAWGTWWHEEVAPIVRFRCSCHSRVTGDHPIKTPAEWALREAGHIARRAVLTGRCPTCGSDDVNHQEPQHYLRTGHECHDRFHDAAEETETE